MLNLSNAELLYIYWYSNEEFAGEAIFLAKYELERRVLYV